MLKIYQEFWSSMPSGHQSTYTSEMPRHPTVHASAFEVHVMLCQALPLSYATLDQRPTIVCQYTNQFGHPHQRSLRNVQKMQPGLYVRHWLDLVSNVIYVLLLNAINFVWHGSSIMFEIRACYFFSVLMYDLHDLVNFLIGLKIFQLIRSLHSWYKYM